MSSSSSSPSTSLTDVKANFWIRLYQGYKVRLDNIVFRSLEAGVSKLLALFGVPASLHPDHEHIGLWTTICATTLFNYWFWFGYRHRNRRKRLEAELTSMRISIQELEQKIFDAENEAEDDDRPKKTIRIFMDGAFDMMHYGHMNAFRQGAALGTYLVVGVNSDESITKCKGKPVNTDDERMKMVLGCRWVDEVIHGVPYVMTDEYLVEEIIKKHNIDFVVHGDDPCIVDGKDVYEGSKKLGKYKSIPRTEGISTTDIVGRMLLMTKSHHNKSGQTSDDVSFEESEGNSESEGTSKLLSQRATNTKRKVLLNPRSNFLTNMRIVRLFSANFKPPLETDTVVYLAGSWDMFHCGHVSLLEEAKRFNPTPGKEGTGKNYVIVGIHNDAVVNAQRGWNLPILNMNERILSVMGCKHVDDVLFDAPFIITNELLSSLKVKFVLKGKVDPVTKSRSVSISSGSSSVNTDSNDSSNSSSGNPNSTATATPTANEAVAVKSKAQIDPYKVPSELKILHEINSKTDLTVYDIVTRITDGENRTRFEVKFQKKIKAEEAYYEAKYAETYGVTQQKKQQAVTASP